ncbi:hypothetical protein EVAR_81459_1 [Eumeta japonica]|uniref:Uncharacterized protein n=1 Tax=Eumeta variegata TaxID=151549 RepID=A0A4C1VYM4_EUMVA|nr:hypothetical protein EVAR_81459_1 [Eumeta japonica]
MSPESSGREVSTRETAAELTATEFAFRKFLNKSRRRQGFVDFMPVFSELETCLIRYIILLLMLICASFLKSMTAGGGRSSSGDHELDDAARGSLPPGRSRVEVFRPNNLAFDRPKEVCRGAHVLPILTVRATSRRPAGKNRSPEKALNARTIIAIRSSHGTPGVTSYRVSPRIFYGRRSLHSKSRTQKNKFKRERTRVILNEDFPLRDAEAGARRLARLWSAPLKLILAFIISLTVTLIGPLPLLTNYSYPHTSSRPQLPHKRRRSHNGAGDGRRALSLSCARDAPTG